MPNRNTTGERKDQDNEQQNRDGRERVERNRHALILGEKFVCSYPHWREARTGPSERMASRRAPHHARCETVPLVGT